MAKGDCRRITGGSIYGEEECRLGGVPSCRLKRV
jgi:hypothetical protein